MGKGQPLGRGRASGAERGFEAGPSQSRGRVDRRPLSFFVQWLTNAVANEGARRPAPLGPAWTRARLAAGVGAVARDAAAVELRRLDEQRTSRTTTNYRVDTQQTRLIGRATARILSAVEPIDTSAATAASCARTFANTADLATRKDYWRQQIDAMASTTAGQAVLVNWIVGKEKFSAHSTIRAATDEASEQIECMRKAIQDARKSSSLADPMKRRPTRNFDQQLCIWLWKYGYHSDPRSIGLKCGASKRFGSMREDTVAYLHGKMPGKSARFGVTHEWELRDSAHQTAWITHLTPEQREREILQTSSAPATSRHHWGTDVDYGNTTGSYWLTKTKFKNLHRWLQANAMAFGMVQVYTADRPGYTATSKQTGYDGYIEERWHWSYYPVAQAILEWSSQSGNKTAISARMRQVWNEVRTHKRYAKVRRGLSWTSSTDPFVYVGAHWENYVFNVNRYVTPPIV